MYQTQKKIVASKPVWEHGHISTINNPLERGFSRRGKRKNRIDATFRRCSLVLGAHS